MKISSLWKRYEGDTVFDWSVLPDSIVKSGITITYEPGAAILFMGDPVEHVYFVKSGVIQGIRQYDNGNDYQYFECTRENGYIGLLEILARRERYAATLIAQTRVEILEVDAALAYGFVQSTPEVLRSCLFVMANDFYRLSGSTGSYFYKSGLARTISFMENYYREHVGDSGVVTVDLGYQEIASRLAVSMRTVGRSIQSLKEQGMLTSRRKRLTISRQQYERLRGHLGES